MIRWWRSSVRTALLICVQSAFAGGHSQPLILLADLPGGMRPGEAGLRRGRGREAAVSPTRPGLAVGGVPEPREARCPEGAGLHDL